MIDTGDAVKHGPTGETWLVAYVEGDRLAWCGWPEGFADLADCTLTRKATPEQRIKLLREMAADGRTQDRRYRVARAVLEREGLLQEAQGEGTPQPAATEGE